MLINAIRYLLLTWKTKLAEKKLQLSVVEGKAQKEYNKRKHQEILYAKQCDFDFKNQELRQKAESLSLETELKRRKEEERINCLPRTQVVTFFSNCWTKMDHAEKEVRGKAEVHKISHQYRYSREIYIGLTADNTSKTHPFKMKLDMVFSNDLEPVLDPRDEALKLIFNEAAELLPQLLVHPNEQIREVAKKFYKQKA